MAKIPKRLHNVHISDFNPNDYVHLGMAVTLAHGPLSIYGAPSDDDPEDAAFRTMQVVIVNDELVVTAGKIPIIGNDIKSRECFMMAAQMADSWNDGRDYKKYKKLIQSCCWRKHDLKAPGPEKYEEEYEEEYEEDQEYDSELT